jgi:5-methylcytosine-specific restriction endonuclease McrA
VKPSEFRPEDWIDRPGWKATVVKRLRSTMPDGYNSRWDTVYPTARPRWNPDWVRRMLLQRQDCRCKACDRHWANAYMELEERAIDHGYRGLLAYEIDHIVPLTADGDHAVDNMQLLCRKCHRAKTSAERRAKGAPA